MVEYGQGVGQATGAGGAVGGGGPTDLTAGAAAFVQNTIDSVAALPPEQLALLVIVVVVLGLIVLRKAF